MKDLSLHILDIVENSIRADASLTEILIIEDPEKDLLTLRIKDNGKGMDQQAIRQSTDPFFTTKSGKRIGMGLALLDQATREAEGTFEISFTPTKGTSVEAIFRYSHPDRKPLGDIPATLLTLVAANPGIDFLYEHRKGTEVAQFDTRKVGKL